MITSRSRLGGRSRLARAAPYGLAGGRKLKYFIIFVVAMYLLATVAFGVKHYIGHPEQGLLDAVVGGLAWPGALVEMASAPGL